MSNTETYERVTQVIIDLMEQGTAPWRQPWSDAGIRPTSVATGKAYRGINGFVLSAVQMAYGYEQPLWLTFKQAKTLGGSVRKGEKSTTVILWKPMEKRTETGEVERFMLVRTFSVFNIAQTDGVKLPAGLTVTREKVTIPDAIQAATDAYVDGPTIRWTSTDGAHYTSALDILSMPPHDTFTSPEGMAQTFFHELTHSTGHESRLNRSLRNGFGTEAYAEEELIAELGSALLADMLGVDVQWEQSAAYCESWLKVLRNDRSLLVKAAQKAQKAVDRIMAHQPAEAAEPELVAA